jgi:NhaA family Na+:H+ antiporter
VQDPHAPASPTIPRPQILTERALSALERFSHIEAVSGIALLVAALIALAWANSGHAASYVHFWETPMTLTIGSFSLSQSLHFLVNDGLMTVFFLVVGAEIRQEIHNGALATFKLAFLPLGAALGGVVTPALIYLAINHGTEAVHGWAIPTATDIAFAVGVLALLGKSVPGGVRVLLLALAIIDDIVAILIIAVFYNSSLDVSGIAIALAGIAMVLAFQRMGIAQAVVYILPGSIIWYGLLKTGVHPTLAGVILGLLTPVRCKPMRVPWNCCSAASRIWSSGFPAGVKPSNRSMCRSSSCAWPSGISSRRSSACRPGFIGGSRSASCRCSLWPMPASTWPVPTWAAACPRWCFPG